MTVKATVQLRDAEAKAWQLFEAAKPFIVPGTTESALNTKVQSLAKQMFGIDTYWHKRIVRSGPNTMAPYAENPADRTIDAQDIVFFDFGPVFSQWEADVGKTYVVGDDPHMHRMVADIEDCWDLGKQYFDAHPDITGAELFGHVKGLAEDRGWEYLIAHAGHLIGAFPHEHIQGETKRNYIHPDNHEPMRAPDLEGRPREWILELHFVDRGHQFGAFFEQLLTVP